MIIIVKSSLKKNIEFSLNFVFITVIFDFGLLNTESMTVVIWIIILLFSQKQIATNDENGCAFNLR